MRVRKGLVIPLRVFWQEYYIDFSIKKIMVVEDNLCEHQKNVVENLNKKSKIHESRKDLNNGSAKTSNWFNC